MENGVKKGWETTRLEQKEKVKEKLLDVFSRGTQGVLEEPNYSKEKLAEVIVEVMKREWPQKWANLLPKMIEEGRKEATQCHLCLLVLKSLAEDLLNFSEDLTPARKKSLLKGFSESSSLLYSFLVDFVLSSQFSLLSSLANPSLRKNSPQAKTALLLVRTALLFFKYSIPWFKLE